jgi:flagellar protein FlgJ
MMDVQYLNSAYVPLSSSAVPGLQKGESGAFADILKQVQNSQASSSSQVSNKSAIDKSDKLYELCQELETFLIKNLIKSMRSTVQKTKLINPGFAGEMYEDMLYDEYAKTFSRNANFGLAEMAYRDLTGYR